MISAKEPKTKEKVFEKEADLCSAFILALPESWTAYPETGGFDIVLVRKEDGFQIGVEAKLKLNAKVISQAAEDQQSWYLTSEGPDCRAVLVPQYASYEMAHICKLLGLTIIFVQAEKQRWNRRFRPELPELKSVYSHDDWHECSPQKRIRLPDWVPDVEAGHNSPVMLTHWKIGAIKLAIIIEKRGFLKRQDFKAFRISMSRWTQGKWILQNGSGGWIKGNHFPDFRQQHPVNYVQIEADYEKWMPKEIAA